MVELATLQAVSYIIDSLGVFVAAVYYMMNVQNNKRNQELMLKAQQQTLETRQSQLMMQLFDYFMEGGIRLTAMEMLSEKWSWNDFDDFMKKYGPERNSEAWR